MSEVKERKPLTPHKVLSSSTNFKKGKDVEPTADEIMNINSFNFHRHLSNHPAYVRLAERFSKHPLLTPIETQYKFLRIVSKQFGPVRYIIGKKKDKTDEDILNGIMNLYKVNKTYAKNILDRYRKAPAEYQKLLKKIEKEGKVK